MSHALVDALRARGVDVLTPLDAEMMSRSDEEQLQFAADSGRAMFSFNVGDFYHLHRKWQHTGWSTRESFSLNSSSFPSAN